MSRSTLFSGPRGGILAILVLFGVALLANWLDAPEPPIAGLGRASDGDSLRLDGARIRLIGLDAPELAQLCDGERRGSWPCGAVARERMAELLSAGPLDCQPQGRDRYDRVLARCTVNRADIAATMVSEGLAVSSGDYWREEAAARAARLGIWDGDFEIPADWRDEHARPSGFLGWLGL